MRYPPDLYASGCSAPGLAVAPRTDILCPGRVGKDELSKRPYASLCQAARAHLAARQQHLRLRGLGADDISVFIVVAVAYLLSTPGARANYRPDWAHGCRA